MNATRALLLIALLLSVAAQAQDDRRPGLQILVYGATGNVGTHIVDEAVARGHFVTAVSRDPSRIERREGNMIAVRGDLLNKDSIALLARGKDVIIVSVRGVIGEAEPQNALQYIAVRNVIEELRRIGRGRLIHVGGSGTLEVEPGVLYAEELPNVFIPANLEAEIQGQILALEYLRTVDDVEWSYATPPKNFTNGPRTGDFRIGGDTVLEDDRGRSRISRADFAVAVLDEAELELHTGQRFSVAY